jgi:hypothetical protein
VGLPTTTNVATALTLRPQQRAAPTSSSSQTNGPAGASLDTSRNRGTPRTHWGTLHDQGRMRVCKNAAEQHKTPSTCWGKRLPTRAPDDAGRHPLHDKVSVQREGSSWNRPHHPPPNTKGRGTDRPPPPYTSGTHHYTDASRRRVKLPADERSSDSRRCTPDGHRVQTVDQDTTLMGTQPTTQSSWQYTQQSQTRGKSTSLPSRIARRPSTRSST